MKTRITTAILFMICVHAGAMLQHGEQATLTQHLEEVNPEWKNYRDFLDAQSCIEICFASETDRIRTHLLMAIRMVNKNSAGLKPHKMRASLMAQLQRYAMEGIFPENISEPQRIPHFIDHRGVYCAVGFLMQQNGFEPETRFIHENMNLAYIRQIPAHLLEDWKNVSGLTIDEMALIQPGYPIWQNWTTHGANINGDVKAIAKFQNEIIVAGDFTVNSEQLNIAVVVNGLAESLGVMLNGVATGMAVFEDKLYISGNFQGQNLAVFDGIDIEYETVGVSKMPYSYCLLTHNNNLYMSIDASGFVAASAIMQFDGDAWTEIGHGNTPTYVMTTYQGNLVAAGEPGNITDADFNVLNVATWNGASWTQLGEGFEKTVRGAIQAGDDLLVCGAAYSFGDEFYGLATFAEGTWHEDDTPQWDEIMEDSYMNSGEEKLLEMKFEGLEWVNEKLYVYGDIPWIGISSIYGSGILEVEETDNYIWHAVVPVFPESYGGVHDIEFADDVLWAGGAFQHPYPEEADFHTLASSTDFEIAINDIDSPTALGLFPNPARGMVTVNASGRLNITSLHVVCTDGRVLEVETTFSSKTEINISAWAPGIYCIMAVTDNGQQTTSRLVVN